VNNNIYFSEICQITDAYTSTRIINVHAPRLSQHPSTPIALLPAKLENNNPTNQVVEVDDAPGNLLSLSFTSTEPNHPDFIPLHHGYPQDVRISLAPAVFQGALEPVVAIWSFLMATLKPEDANVKEEPGEVSLLTNRPQRNKMRIRLNLTKVQGTCVPLIWKKSLWLFSLIGPAS
jgi:hypothetical protein